MASGGSGNTNHSTGAYIVCLFVAIIGITLYFKHNYHVYAFFWKHIRLLEMAPFYFIPDWFPIYGKLEIQQAVQWLWKIPATDIMPKTVEKFDSRYLRWFSIYPAMIMIYWGVKRIIKSDNMSTRYDMESLLREFSKRYPDLKPLVNTNPNNKPIEYKRGDKESYRWGMPLNAVQFSKAIPPFGLEAEAKKNSAYKLPIWDGNEGFDENLARLSFETQLGRLYGGINEFVEYEKQVFNAIYKKISVDAVSKADYFNKATGHVFKAKGMVLNEKNFGVGFKKLCKYISDDFESKQQKNKGVAPNKQDYFNEAFVNKTVLNMNNAVLQDIFKLVLAEEIMSLHAHTRIGFIRLFEQARRTGVFTAPSMKWVLPYDRCLYTCFSSVGRKTPFVEAAGCFAHFYMEKHLGRSLTHPEVTEAVEGLKKALWLHLDLL